MRAMAVPLLFRGTHRARGQINARESGRGQYGVTGGNDGGAFVPSGPIDICAQVAASLFALAGKVIDTLDVVVLLAKRW